MGIPPLDITARTTLGAMLVLSSAYFQSGAAELIAAEGDKVQKMLSGVSIGSVGVGALDALNRSILRTMASLSNLEGQINRKIAAGTHLHNDPAW